MSTGTVFVSTGSFRARPADAVTQLINGGVCHVELSGGVPHEGIEQSVEQMAASLPLQLHNYFPPADPPFVFNLASPVEGIRQRTITSMVRALDLSARIGAERYSLHAGFLVDPPVSFLGSSWRSLERTDIDQAQGYFIDSVLQLREVARSMGVRLLIENNVLTRGTRDECGEDVLLMATGEQITEVMERLPDDVALLMDVAHLKVTAKTLDLDPLNELDLVSAYIAGYHLSDNDGFSDTNGPVTCNSWFWSALKSNVEFATLEVAPGPGIDFKSQVDLTETLWQGGRSR